MHHASICASLVMAYVMGTNGFLSLSVTPKTFQPCRSTSSLTLSKSDEATSSTITPDPSARNIRITTPLSIASLLLSPSITQAKDTKGTAFETACKTYFPGSLSSSTITLRVSAALRKRNYRPYNTLMGTSLDADEEVETTDSLKFDLRDKLLTKNGGVFHLGGLGGIPFAGTTGMASFLHHVPNEEGKVLILFGPGVGLSEEGEVGKVKRIGMEQATTCGAVVDAYDIIESGKGKSGGSDLEMDFLVQKLKENLGSDASAERDSKLVLAAIKLYDVVWEMLKEQVNAAISQNAKFWESVTEVCFLGGIVVNRGTLAGDDFFQPLMMKAVAVGGETDLYEETFGDLSTPRKFVTGEKYRVLK